MKKLIGLLFIVYCTCSMAAPGWDTEDQGNPNRNGNGGGNGGTYIGPGTEWSRPQWNPTPYGNNPMANPCLPGYYPAYYGPNLFTCVWGR